VISKIYSQLRKWSLRKWSLDLDSVPICYTIGCLESAH
ncbi:unnamed protein product, partial [Acidithrix sp. C25]